MTSTQTSFAATRFALLPRPKNVDHAMALLPEGADIDEGVLSSAFLVSPYASFVLDWHGHILVCNRRAERMYCPSGLEDADELRGASFASLTKHSREEIGQMLRDGAAKGVLTASMTAGHQMLPSTGSVFRVSLLRSATRGEGLYLLTQDQLKSTADALAHMNAHRKEARDNLLRLEAAHHELFQSLVTMEAFAHAASHDMRTPLNTLSGLLDMFGETYLSALPESAAEYIGYMSRAVEQMRGLTEDLLEHAHTTSSILRAEQVSLRKIVEIVCADMDHEISDEGAIVSLNGDDFLILAEPLLLQVLISNLVSNALKYRHPDREPDVSIVLESDEKSGKSISIRDNGIGIGADKMGDIFKPFFRIPTEKQGNGIGLSTCKEVCRRHGWKIEADSTIEVGTSFKISF